MHLYYGKTIAVALATFLVAGTASVQASSRFNDVSFKFAKEEDNNFNPDLTGLNTILRNPDSTTIKNHTHTLCKLWDDKKNGKYNNQHTFMDILMESIKFNSTSLKAGHLNETSQFRAILTGRCYSVNIQKSDPIWQSINKLDDKAASLWFKAMIAARSKDKTFFSSYFNLSQLYLSSNNLTSVDVSENTELTILNIVRNNLTYIDVSKNTKLTDLLLSETKLNYIDVSQNIALKSLYLSGNDLTSLDVSHNPELACLLLYRTNLTSIDLSKNTELIDLGISCTNLTSVDVSHNPELTFLMLSNNPSLKKEDVKGVTSNMEVKW